MTVPGGDASADRFELRGELGAGGMGKVFRVLDRTRGVEVALKVLRRTTGRDVFRFKREFRALADLAHPNLVSLYELYTVGDDWMFTMELVEGVRFHTWVRPGGPAAPLDEARLRDALYQLADGLTALHAAGKVHRDLKPSNVLVDATGRVVVLDFGLAADVEALGRDQTHDEMAVGTPAYMSPEQGADRPLTAASDWYSVGVMLYEALTGKRPFEGPSAFVVAAKQHRDPPAPSTIDPAVSPALDALCMRLLDRDPARRPDGPAVLAALAREPSPWTRRIVERRAPAPPEMFARELATLDVALAESRDHCIVVLVRGTRGSGKTSLLDAFVARARAGGAVVLTGRAGQREDLPFRAIDRLIDDLTAYLLGLDHATLVRILPRDVAALARLFPVLRRVPEAQVPLLPGMPLDEAALRQRAFTALCDLFRALTAERPLVIALDDIQWGTAAGSRVLIDFFEGPDAPRVLMVMAHRAEDTDSPLLQHLRAWRGDTRTIDLPRRVVQTE